MRYLGGKSRIARPLADVVNAAIVQVGADLYCEPFVGGLAVMPRIVAPRRVAADACAPLITLYQAVQAGTWTPPDFVSERLYHAVKRDPDPADPLTAFVGFGVSFGGKWFGGYARDRVREQYAPGSKRSLARAFATCSDVEFVHRCVFDWPASDVRHGSVWYCDPPYHGTTSYRGVPPWDAPAFFGLVRWMSRRGALVFVSEYQAPPDFVPVWSQDVPGILARGKRDVRTERLFVHRSAFAIFDPFG